MVGRVLGAARKLRGREPRELRERGTQALAAWLERVAPGATAGGVATVPQLVAGIPQDPDTLLARFRGERPAPFFAAFDDPAATLAALRARCPADAADATRRADRARAGAFDLLGYTNLAFGPPDGVPDWHLDPVAGRRAPRRHWSRVPYLDPAVVGDHKVVWEVNRHQYFVALGQVYWYTGDERYAETCAAHLESWLRENPPKRGVNWASSLEVAYRAISWLWALHFFRRSPALTPALYARLLGVLDAHGRHVERYLSTYFSPNTHLTGEALGLYYLGTLLPELAAAERWRATGRAILLEQVGKQVYADGVYFEQATQYHRYTAEIFLHFQLLAERSGDAEAATRVRPAVERLFVHLLHAARPDGTLPLVGDDDGGRLVQLDGRPARDVRALLATGAAVFGRADLAWGAHVGRPGEDVAAAVWLLGPAALDTLDALTPAPPAGTSRAFPDGGYWTLRDGWDDGAAWAFLDCGPHGAMNCGHAHADALSLEVAAYGRALLVDAGTYTYPGPERNAFRAAAAHNTVTIDGASASEPAAGAFQWAHVARARTVRWATHPACDLFVGEQDGFARLDSPATHERTVLFAKARDRGAAPFWVVRDRVRSAGTEGLTARVLTAHWHLAPGLAVEVAGGGGTVRVSDPAGGDPAAGDGAAPRLVFLLAGFGDAAGAFRVDDGWVSFAYGAREAAPVARWTQAAGGDQEAVTFLVPVPPGRPAPRVRELPTVGGRAFEVAFGDASDPAPGAGVLVLLRGAADTAVEAAGVLTDADAALVWRDAGGAPRRVAFAGGRSLRAGADTIVRSGGTPGDRAAGDWHAADLTERLD